MKRYLVLPLLTLAVAGCDAMTAHTDVVARVGQHELTVDEAVDLMAGNPQIPAAREVVGSVADLWVDYTLLAELAAEDSTLAQVDVEPVIRPFVEQQLFTQLRDQVVTSDTVFTDEELQEIYETEAPGTRVRARHILLTLPDAAPESERDSIYALAETLRERATAGEDFAALAREYSGDPGTAQQGGDLGWFERGNMVEPFENAAFALQPGEVSEVVETPFGLHIIKVEDRETPSMEEMGDDFRRRVISQRRQASLDSYVDSLRAEREFQMEQGAQEVARDLAGNPSAQLSGRAASRQLVSWGDGALTAREVANVFRRMPPQQRGQYTELTDEQMERLLREVATNELVLDDARARGITVPEEEQDSVRQLVREQLGRLVQNAGLVGSPQEGETEFEAVQRRVRALLSAIVTGQRSPVPLGSLPYMLRDQRDWDIHERTFPEVVERLEARRSPATDSPASSAGQPPAAPGGQQPRPAPDTGG